MLKPYWPCFSSSDGIVIYNDESCKGPWWLRWPMWHLTSSLDSTFVFFGVKHLSELTRNVKLEKGFLRWPNQNTNTKLVEVNFEAVLRHKLPEGRNKIHWGCSHLITGWYNITIGRLRTGSGAVISRLYIFKYAIYDWVVKEVGQWYRLVEYIQLGGWGVGQSHLVKMPRHKVT